MLELDFRAVKCVFFPRRDYIYIYIFDHVNVNDNFFLNRHYAVFCIPLTGTQEHVIAFGCFVKDVTYIV